ncbi:MAG: hypothetical protein AAGA54_33965 [Myxococcota bacterium]
MGWSVHYVVIVPGTVTPEDSLLLEQHLRTWNAELHEGSEAMSLVPVPFEQRRAEPLTGAMFREIEIMLGTYAYGPDGPSFEAPPVSADNTYLWGFTKVQYSAQPSADFCTVIRALQDLARARKGWTIYASDDYDTVPRLTHVASLPDPEDLLQKS